MRIALGPPGMEPRLFFCCDFGSILLKTISGDYPPPVSHLRGGTKNLKEAIVSARINPASLRYKNGLGLISVLPLWFIPSPNMKNSNYELLQMFFVLKVSKRSIFC